MPKVKIALAGFGTIGTGVIELLEGNKEIIKNRTGLEIEIKYIIDIDWETPRRVESITALKISDYKTALADPEIAIVIELIGGVDFAYKLVEKSLIAGKNVVTANKALLAERGMPLFQLAKENSKSIGFEGSVCGGIPIIRTVYEALSGEKIQSIYGIVNGTTNYILTKMTEDALDFDTALKQAQELGFAEKVNPSLDICGYDAAHKITILASLAFNTPIEYSQVYTQGIKNMELEDIYNADELGYIIKLLAVAKLDPDNTVEVRVNPTLVPKDNQLAFVRNEFNAVMIESEFLGNSMYFGRGAGSRPTATAVVGDVINIAKSLNNPDGYLTYSQFNNYPVKKIGEIESRYYVRFNVIDKPGVLSKISGVFGNYQISIASVIQKERSKTDYVPLIMTTHAALEKNINQALDEIEKMDFNKKRGIMLRIME